MDYDPWPEAGCPLSEVLQRVACDKAEFIQHVAEKTLVVFGRTLEEGSFEEIAAPLVSSANWSASTISGSGGAKFDTVTVFPAVLAPNRVQVIGGHTLAEAFRKFVLKDPEVASLANRALAVSPEYESVFLRGNCHVAGIKEWPVAFERWSTIEVVHPDPAKRPFPDVPMDPDPMEVVRAAAALLHRYHALILMFRKGELEVSGFPLSAGHPSRISRAIWSHEEFHFDSSTGDLLQDNDGSFGDGRYIKRWIGLELNVPTERSEHATLDAFHVKPIVSYETRRSTLKPRSRPIDTRINALNECTKWLESLFNASPHRRTRTNDDLYREAQRRWPQKISKRGFNLARAQAISATGAVAWGRGGRPEESNRHAD